MKPATKTITGWAYGQARSNIDRETDGVYNCVSAAVFMKKDDVEYVAYPGKVRKVKITITVEDV